jgi:DNA ligase (NAD+)
MINYVPEVCPACKSKLEWIGVDLVCPNKLCVGKQYENLKTWIMNVAPVENVGSILLFKYLDELDINSIEELYNFRDNYEEYVCDDRVSSQNFSKVLDKLFNQNIDIRDALIACNIQRLGPATVSELVSKPDLVKALISVAIYGNEIPDDLVRDITDIVGKATAEKIFSVDGLNKLMNLRFVENQLVYPEVKELIGQVCITGSLSIKRADFEKLIKNKGFTVGSINKNTMYLITDDPFSGSEKNKKADKLGVTKITEKEFREKYGI